MFIEGCQGDGEEPLPSDELAAPDLLDFAGIEPAHVLAAPLEQHLAEKLHAYTLRYADDRPSSRPKDLIDKVLIADLASFEATRLREVINRLFAARATHSAPQEVPPPPADWSRPYRTLASELEIDPDPLAAAGTRARERSDLDVSRRSRVYARSRTILVAAQPSRRLIPA